MGTFTQGLADWRSGDAQAAAVKLLFESTYAELKSLAHAQLRRNGSSATLNTTGLVHEAYLRFVNLKELNLEDRGHFMVYASKVMRSVIIDLVRRQSAARRGAHYAFVNLDAEIDGLPAKENGLLQIDEALSALGRIDPQLERIVEMRFFAGLSVDSVADHLGLSPRSVFRYWEKAKLLLLDALRP